MKMKNRALALILVFSFSVPIFLVTAPEAEDPLLVLFDEAHGQFFNRTIYSKAITAIEALPNAKVIFTSHSLNATTLAGIDVLIITNPGPDAVFSDDELFLFNDFVKKGKGAFILGNSFNENKTLTGRVSSLNNLLREVQETQFYDDIIVKDEGYLNESSNIRVKVNSTSHEVFSFINNVTSMITRSSSIQARSKLSKAGHDAYSKDSQGLPNLARPNPTVFGVSAYGAPLQARVAVSGSSWMFSDLINPYFDKSWFDCEDNSYFWGNVISWLGKVPQEEITDEMPSSLSTNQFLIGLFIFGFVFVAIGGITHNIGTRDVIESVETQVVKKREKLKEKLPEEEKPSVRKPKRKRKLRQIPKAPPKGGKNAKKTKRKRTRKR